MKEYYFDRLGVQNGLRRLVSAKDEAQLWMAKQLLGESFLGTRTIVSLPMLTNETDIPSQSISPLLITNHITSYFQYPNLYFIYRDRLLPIGLKVGYTVNFDTSYASYIRNIVTNRSLSGLDKPVSKTIDQMLRRDMDFNPFFYFIENFKLVNTTSSQKQNEVTPQTFWESLNKNFKENIVALHTFKNVDCKSYVKNREIRFNIGSDQAYQNSIEFTYNFYSGEGIELANIFLELQRLLVLQILGMFRIQYSSRKSAKHKLKEFMEFVQEKGVVLFERELVAIYKYFYNRNSVSLFNRVNMGGNQANLLEKINNMAWDMLATRYLERILLLQDADFTIPLFASSDKALTEYFKLFPVKLSMVHRPSQNVISIPETITEQYFIKEGCGDIVKQYLSPEFKNKRIAGFNVGNDVISERTKSELQELLSVLTHDTNI